MHQYLREHGQILEEGSTMVPQMEQLEFQLMLAHENLAEAQAELDKLQEEYVLLSEVAGRLGEFAKNPQVISIEGVKAYIDTLAELEQYKRALAIAVSSNASNFCVFNGVEKELWPDYCKNPPETEHAVCVKCWVGYALAEAKEAADGQS